MANLPVISFNAGKLTPLVDVRSDTEKYASGCRILDNMIPLIYGPVTRRPGTKYIADVADHSVKSRLVSFIFSSTIAYDIEFGDRIMNVYFNGTLVDSGIVTPYLEADLFQLQFEQSADVMWITHSSYQPRKLSRVSASEFTLSTITFDDGPFLERNDIENDDGRTLTVRGYTIATATSATDTFTIDTTTDLTSLFPVNQRFYVTGSAGNDGAYTVLSSSFSSPTMTIVSNEDFTDDTNNGQIMVDGGTVTLTASSAVFTTGTSGHTGSLFKITHKRLQTAAKGTKTSGTGVIGEVIDVKGSWTFTTTGNWGGTVEIQRNEDGTNWETLRTYTSILTAGSGSFNAQKADTEKANGVQYRINATETITGTLQATLYVDKSTQDSIFRITATASTTSATATAVIAAPDKVAAKRWAEGAWSNVRGWPGSMAFFEERACYGFTTSESQNVWLSETGKFETFESGVNAADSFAVTLPTANTGRWLAAMESLIAGTSGDEWRIGSSNIDESVTPENVTIKKQTARGSTNIQAVGVNEAIIFIDSVARKVREHTFSDAKQKNVSPDLTALAQDITSGGITSLAVQKNPDSIIWFTIANSPYLISMTYEREQNVVAFAEHPLGGNGIVESISITPSTSEDVITLTVKRTINGSTVRFIEQMQPRNWGDDDNDVFFVDAGITDTGGTTTITGLDHLEGETVSVLADMAVQASKVVSGGQITIDEAAGTVHVGLPFTYKVSPVRPDVSSATGTTLGSIKKVSELVISFFKTSLAKYGDGIDTREIDWRTTEDYDSPPALFTGLKTVTFDGGFSTEDNIVISGSDPLPCTVRAIIPRIQKTGR